MTIEVQVVRKPIVAGNWKMNLVLADAVELARRMDRAVRREKLGVQVVLFPPFPFLAQVSETLLTNPDLGMGAQNVSPHEGGAHTGEVSIPMLRSVGVSHVLIGHSERRHMYGADDELIASQVAGVHKAGLRPMLCVGETLEERNNGSQTDVVQRQLSSALDGMEGYNFDHLVIAYEPVWAIGTGENAEVDQIEEMHGFIRSWCSDHLSEEAADSVRVLYGGSLNPENSKEIFDLADVDGGLVGGASLTYDSFYDIVLNASPGGKS